MNDGRRPIEYFGDPESTSTLVGILPSFELRFSAPLSYRIVIDENGEHPSLEGTARMLFVKPHPIGKGAWEMDPFELLDKSDELLPAVTKCEHVNIVRGDAFEVAAQKYDHPEHEEWPKRYVGELLHFGGIDPTRFVCTLHLPEVSFSAVRSWVPSPGKSAFNIKAASPDIGTKGYSNVWHLGHRPSLRFARLVIDFNSDEARKRRLEE